MLSMAQGSLDEPSNMCSRSKGCIEEMRISYSWMIPGWPWSVCIWSHLIGRFLKLRHYALRPAGYVTVPCTSGESPSLRLCAEVDVWSLIKGLRVHGPTSDSDVLGDGGSRYGKALAAACKSTEQADKEIREILLIVKSLWFRIESQVLIVRKLSQHLPDEFSIHQNLLLGVLQGHLQDLTSKVEKLLANLSLMRRVVYATILKESLEKAVQNLEKWYHRWDPSWLMLARLTDPHVDNVIRAQRHDVQGRHAVKVIGGLRDAHRANADRDHHAFAFLPVDVRLNGIRPITHSTAALATRSDNRSVVIVDSVKLRPGVAAKHRSRDIQALARVLSRLDPEACNLLTCNDVKENFERVGASVKDLKDFSLLFELPPIASARVGDNARALVTSYDPVSPALAPPCQQSLQRAHTKTTA
nr:hypothetical protein CFP56_31753 [Quercus suber]